MTSRQEEDPTNQGHNRNRATTETNKRLRAAEKSVIALWSLVTQPKRTSRKKIINNETLTYWNYDLTEFELEDIEADVVDVINEDIETVEEKPPIDWYLIPFLLASMRGAVIQQNVLIELLLLPEDSVISDTTLIHKLNPLRQSSTIDTYKSMRAMSSTLSKQVMTEIKSGIAAGLSKSEIKQLIIKRFDVAKSAAKRIADTEINKVNNDAKIQSAKIYRDSGVLVAVIHLSALLPTTRSHHAARHGLVYTPEQQLRWWDKGSNRINCKCSVKTVRVNKDGTVKNTRSQKDIIKRGKKFFK